MVSALACGGSILVGLWSSPNPPNKCIAPQPHTRASGSIPQALTIAIQPLLAPGFKNTLNFSGSTSLILFGITSLLHSPTASAFRKKVCSHSVSVNVRMYRTYALHYSQFCKDYKNLRINRVYVYNWERRKNWSLKTECITPQNTQKRDRFSSA